MFAGPAWGPVMATCIYCRGEDTSFTREHVVPEAFGTFEDNLVLHEVVCAGCNDYFGRTIDRILARGSFEGVHRIREGVVPAAKVAGILRDRVRIVLDEPGEERGLRFALVASDTGDLGVRPETQVGFERADNSLEFVTDYELADLNFPLPESLGRPRRVVIYSEVGDEERVVQLLESRGIPFNRESQVPGPITPGQLVSVQQRTRVDDLVRRCIAKIAVNYLAHVEGSGLVLEPDFDAVRVFVRYGSRPAYPIIRSDRRPILFDDLQRERQTNGHLLTVNWAADRRSLVGQVSLFNEATYSVSLARDYAGIWRPIGSGHHFDVGRARVMPMLHVARIVVPRLLANF